MLVCSQLQKCFEHQLVGIKVCCGSPHLLNKIATLHLQVHVVIHNYWVIQLSLLLNLLLSKHHSFYKQSRRSLDEYLRYNLLLLLRKKRLGLMESQILLRQLGLVWERSLLNSFVVRKLMIWFLMELITVLHGILQR